MDDVYYHPEKIGLDLIGDVEWSDEPYEFDMTAVWQDPTTRGIYYADDSGCSCPSPFENFHTRDDLTCATKAQVIAHLRSRGALKAESLIDRVRALPIH